MKCYIEIKKTVIEKIPIKTVINDCIKFYELLGFYKISHATDLACGPAVDETNEAIIDIEQIGMKYGLYNDKEACSDPWYHDEVLIPKMEKFFKENCFIKTE